LTTKKKMFSCSDCPRIYITPQLLAIHRKKVHGVEGTSRSAMVTKYLKANQPPEHPAPNQCPYCGFPSLPPQGLAVHVGVHHKAERMKAEQLKAGDPKAENFAFQCPQCEFVGKNQGGLALHMNKKHDQITALRPNINKRREIEPSQAQTITIAATSNGHKEDWQGHTDGIPEALIAVTSGRFQELCRSVAYEHDLPPRLFAARVAAFVYGTTLR
jgi:uncharacterized C2H2 Zn-finger protein